MLVGAQPGVKPVLLYLPMLDDLGATNSSVFLKLKRAVSKDRNIPLVELTPDVQPAGKGLYLEKN